MAEKYGSAGWQSRCECCGEAPVERAFGWADESGHMWTSYVCSSCDGRCTSDENGPVHVAAETISPV